MAQQTSSGMTTQEWQDLQRRGGMSLEAWEALQRGKSTKPQPVAAPEMPPPGTLGALARLGMLPSRPLPVNAIQAPTAASMQALRNILAGDY